jgi:serine O-acetyltransferase
MLLQLHTIARWCYLHRIPILPQVIKTAIFFFFNCLLPAECSISRGTRLWHHGWCIGIHPDVEIGQDCNIYNQVEIGGGHDGPDGPPIRIVIGNRVNICAGAKVFCKSGTLTIGDGSTIGANAVVLSDVPPNSLAVGVPARCIPKKRSANVQTVVRMPLLEHSL